VSCVAVLAEVCFGQENPTPPVDMHIAFILSHAGGKSGGGGTLLLAQGRQCCYPPNRYPTCPTVQQYDGRTVWLFNLTNGPYI